MCRLYGFTPTMRMRPQDRRNLFYLAMVFGTAENNRDGWGITDGTRLFKDAPSVAYDRRVPDAISQLDTNGVHWLGHVRAASRDTAVTYREAHPFLMRNTDNTIAFYAAHNGGFPEYIRLVKRDAKGAFPRTDSWYAFRDIFFRNQDTNESLQESIMHFLAHAGKFSEYSLMFLDRVTQQLHVVRGNRPMSVARFSTGEQLYCTSPSVLENLAQMCQMLDMDTRVDDIQDLLPGTYALHSADGNETYTTFPVSEILDF